MIKLNDPKQEIIYYDMHSLGIAITEPNALTYAQDWLKKCINKPAMIVSFSNGERYYISQLNGKPIYCIVINQDVGLYVESMNIEVSIDDLRSKIAKGIIDYTAGAL